MIATQESGKEEKGQHGEKYLCCHKLLEMQVQSPSCTEDIKTKLEHVTPLANVSMYFNRVYT